MPTYANVHISIYGLKFEFPEHHFLRDIETFLPELVSARSALSKFAGLDFDVRRNRDQVAALVAKEKALSRSIISATFSLVEAFLSGLFFTAVHSKLVGRLSCDDVFLKYAATKECAPLRDRLDRVIRFASEGKATASDEPFKDFIDIGKRYRDAIHHTTPFQRKDVEMGGRLTALYEINADIAIQCVMLSTETLLMISKWIDPAFAESDVVSRCGVLLVTAASNNPNYVVERTDP